MRALQKCNNITKNGTDKKKCNSRGVRKVQHYFNFSTNPCILYIVPRFVLSFHSARLLIKGGTFLTPHWYFKWFNTNSPEFPLENSIDLNPKRILMNGCPRQNSKLAWKAFSEIGLMIFKITPHSPDLNPIVSFSSPVVRKLRKQLVEG